VYTMTVKKYPITFHLILAFLHPFTWPRLIVSAKAFRFSIRNVRANLLPIQNTFSSHKAIKFVEWALLHKIVILKTFFDENVTMSKFSPREQEHLTNNVQVLNVSFCPNIIMKLEKKFKHLRKLELLNCARVTCMNFLRHFCSKNISELGILRCENLGNISALQFYSEIRHLQFFHCGNLQDLSPLKYCTKIKQLYITWSPVQDISFLRECSNLEDLELYNCKNVTDISSLSVCTQLQRLVLYNCENVTDLFSLSLCTQLQSVVFNNLSFVDLKPLQKCIHLINLQIIHCTKWKMDTLSTVLSCVQSRQLTHQNFSCWTQLTHLDLSHCAVAVTTVSDIDSCVNLRTLCLDKCYKLRDISPIASCVHIQKLSLVLCKKLNNISVIGCLKELHTLILNGCTGIQTIFPLRQCTNLVNLQMDNCWSVQNISALASCVKLKQFTMNNCKQVRDISPLSCCRKLQYLDISRSLIPRHVCDVLNISCLIVHGTAPNMEFY